MDKELLIRRGAKQEWENDQVWIKFMNNERKGETHSFTVNGRFFSLEHGKIYKVPRAVISALENATPIRWKAEDVDIAGGGKKPVSYEDPRFLVQELSEEQAMRMMPKEQKSQQSVIKDIIDTQTSKQSAVLDDIINSKSAAAEA